MIGLSPGERGTLLTCPDCWGVLSVRGEGDAGHLYFRCRIGHGFSIENLVAAKEQQLEDRLWAVVLGFHELTEVLEEFDTSLQRLVKDEGVIAARLAGARRDADQVRRLIEANDPLPLVDDRGGGRPRDDGGRPRERRR